MLDKAVELTILRQLHHVIANFRLPLHDAIVFLLFHE
jgi:hypothetical protein